MLTDTSSAAVVLLTLNHKDKKEVKLLDLVRTDDDRLMKQVSNLKHGFVAFRLTLNTFLVAATDAVLDQRRQTTQLRYCQPLHSHQPLDNRC